MAKTTHTMDATLNLALFGYEMEYVGKITFTYLPGHPGTGPTYDCGGTPPEGAEIEISKIHLTRHGGTEVLSVPDWMVDDFLDNSDIHDELENFAVAERNERYEDY